ncbi:MAG: hypothetical protein IT423_14090 [Pirellulaceae bacterium]|nr:hypothetical protein [Pirellulaceae bacterium]
MKRMLAIASVIAWVAAGVCPPAQGRAQTQGQSQATDSSTSATPAANGGGATTAATQAPLIRDPRTGELYQQELQTVEQPVTQWRRKYVDRTVMTPQTVLENQQVPQTTYVATTEYVMQQRLKGWWNPLAEPTYAYEYVPVTRWVPQTTMITRQVPVVKMISRTEQVPVDEPVTTTQKVTQVVLRKLPQNAVGPAGVASPTAFAYQRPAFGQSPAAVARNQPPAAYPGTNPVNYPVNYPVAYPASNSQPLLASVPVLSQQRMLPWQPGTLITAPVSGLRNIVRSATAPLAGSQANYAAPMNVASRPSATWGRDANQAGMAATVVR